MKHIISGRVTAIEQDGNTPFGVTISGKGEWSLLRFKKCNGTEELAKQVRIGQAAEVTVEILEAEEATA